MKRPVPAAARLCACPFPDRPTWGRPDTADRLDDDARRLASVLVHLRALAARTTGPAFLALAPRLVATRTEAAACAALAAAHRARFVPAALWHVTTLAHVRAALAADPAGLPARALAAVGARTRHAAAREVRRALRHTIREAVPIEAIASVLEPTPALAA